MGKPSSGQRVLHLDAFSGAAGNMFLGALLDLGLSRKALLEGLEPLGVDFKLVVKKVERSGFAARYVDVRVPAKTAARKKTEAARAGRAQKQKQPSRIASPPPPSSPHPPSHAYSHGPSHGHLHGHDPSHEPHAHPHTHAGKGVHSHGRRYAEIRDLIDAADLGTMVKARALAIFEALGRAEAKVHGTALEDVHFHEVGAVDAIVDVTGAAVGLEELGIQRVSCTPVAIGHGTIDSDHGLLPLPAPATIELLKGIPTVPAAVAWETLTPTGAAILATVVDAFGWMPAMTIEKIGYGAGNDRPGALPNVLRAVLGTSAGLSGDRVVCIETNLDDLVPEHFDYLMERLFDEGALDVSLQHIQMKKNRPGFLLRVLATPATRDRLARIVFAESTAIGVRLAEWDRLVLERESRRLKTPYGPIRVKIIRGVEGGTSYSPEYDDCKVAARKTGHALRRIVAEVAERAARAKPSEWKSGS